MYNGGTANDGSVSAFKQAEKLYQLHREQVFRQSKGRQRSKGFRVRPLDMSDVIDLQPGVQPPGVTCLGVPTGMPPTATAFAFAAHPGLLVVRGALDPTLQRQLVVDALSLFNQPPNHTNHLVAYPGGLPGLWAAAQQGLKLRQGTAGSMPQQPLQPPKSSSSTDGSVWTSEGSGPSAESLLQRLRWATLGPPYDWTQRLYLRDAPHMPLPEPLRQLALTLADLAIQLLPAAGMDPGSSSSTLPGNVSCNGMLAPSDPHQHQQHQLEQAQRQDTVAKGLGQQAGYSPDAALVNYYYEGDTLNGHRDDAERCLYQPLVSLSLGCPAIFLMGTHTKEDPPTALLLRSGDAIVLSGLARRCYHGVPRILTDQPPAEALRCKDSSDSEEAGSDQVGNCSSGDGGEQDCSTLWGAAFQPFARHMQRCRINVSIRDTR